VPSNARLILGQLSVPEKSNENTAIPALLDHLAETSQLQREPVTIDAMGSPVGHRFADISRNSIIPMWPRMRGSHRL
jgi:predicted transposase YbfD/YdcC